MTDQDPLREARGIATGALIGLAIFIMLFCALVGGVQS